MRFLFKILAILLILIQCSNGELDISLDSWNTAYVVICDQVAGKLTGVVHVKGEPDPLIKIRKSVEKLLINEATQQLPRRHQMCLVLINQDEHLTTTKRKFIWIRTKKELEELEKIFSAVGKDKIRSFGLVFD